jgi:hypothetical protein
MTDQTQEPIAAQTQEPVTQPENASTQGQATAELNLNDLSALKSIIDVATQRGAFRANELEAVGKLYNKLTSFLDTVAKKE